MPREVHNKLTAVKVRQIKVPGRYADGSGLYLHVSETGSKWWIWRGTIRGGERRELGLLGAPTPEGVETEKAENDVTTISLAEARMIAKHFRRLARQGVDPTVERDKDKERTLTFGQAVDRYLEAKLTEFKNEKHRYQWRATLDTASQVLGKMKVSEIEVRDVLRVLKPLWETRTETASRLRGRIERVLAWATVNGYRQGDNPARWRGHLSEALPKPSTVTENDNQPALAIDDMPRWWGDLQLRDGPGAEALKFLTLTVARSGEVRGMRWSEVDFTKKLWTVPAEHTVPLTDEALAVLEGVRGLDAEIVFPSTQRRRGKQARGARPLSDATLNAVMKRMHAAEIKAKRRGYLDTRSKRPAVPHGLRSTFRDWAAESGVDHIMAEIALAHDVGSETQRAYLRTSMVEARRAMMAAWGRAVRGEPEPDNVVQMHGGARA